MRGSEFAELSAFVAIAKERNFRRAATRLGVSPSALSHTMRALEERLGTKLLNRTTRSVAPTDAGLVLLDRLSPAMAEIDSAVAGVGAFRDRPSGKLRLNLPRLAASLVLSPVLGKFARTYPDIELELVIDDGLTDVVAAGFDAGVRLGERVHRDMVAVRLTPDTQLAVVGAPRYLAARGRPQTPLQLGDHACINYRWANSGALYKWEFEGPEGPLELVVSGPLVVNDTDLILAATLQGAGLACLPQTYVAKHLESGELEQVLANWCRPSSGFFLYYPGHRHTTSALRVLIDFLKKEADT